MVECLYRLHSFFREHFVKTTSFLYEVLAKSLNAILSSITLLWVNDVLIGKFALNVPSAGNVLVNFYAIGFIRGWGSLLHWGKKSFKIVIHCEWSLKLILPIAKLYSFSLSRHLHPNDLVILTINLMLVSASF